MKNQVCTIEQMKALKELGVDISKASMCRVSANIGIPATDESRLVENDVNYYGMTFPVFTVVDMLDMMPDSIILDEENYWLEIEKSDGYEVAFKSLDDGWMYKRYYFDSLKEAVFHSFLQLAKDGKL